MQCALQIGIPIIRPSWIVETHKIWLRGDDVDVGQSIEDHRLAPSLGIVSNSDLGFSNSNKRRRTGTAEVEEPWQDVAKDTEAWLLDGNIVVISQSIAFRVRGSVLALHSGVFRDLFLLQPPAEGELPAFEGCPVVQMSDTPPEDLRHLFLALCCGKE